MRIGMRRLRARIMQASCAALAAGVFALTAWGAAAPTSPAPGAVVQSSHPVFKWTLPPGESSESIYIASKPDTTPGGKFHEENVVESDFFLNDPLEWSPTSPLYAGRRWWIVGSRNDETFDSSFSRPSEFTIAPTAKVVSLGVRRYAFLRNLDFTVRWRSIFWRPIVTASISTLSGIRRWSARSVEYGSIGEVGSSLFSWYASRRVRKGSLVRFRATVRAQGPSATVTRKLRAP